MEPAAYTLSEGEVEILDLELTTSTDLVEWEASLAMLVDGKSRVVDLHPPKGESHLVGPGDAVIWEPTVGEWRS